jgi:nicotinate phosphoribosyltransferase
VVNGVYKLVAELSDGTWRGVAKLSEGKMTLPGTKQVFRRFDDGEMAEDIVGTAEEKLDGEPQLVPAMRDGEIVHPETLEEMRERTRRSLDSLPVALRSPGEKPPYPVRHSDGLTEVARSLGEQVG